MTPQDTQHAGAEPVGFGAHLRTLRERAGLTQEELAERAGITVHAVSALERGARSRPYPRTVRSLADALGASADDRAALLAASRPRPSAAPAGPPGPTVPVAAPSPAAPSGAVPSGAVPSGAVPSGAVPSGAVPSGAVPSRAAPPTAVPDRRLPAPATPLLGRDRDVTEVVTLLRRQERRLVTLTGLGGVGKTRLAIAVAEAVAGDFPDGMAFVPLAPVTDAGLVPPAIGHALGLGPAEGLPALVALLRERSMLLVLDNFEHVTAAAPLVSVLLAACPHLTVLVTSRGPLRLRGETEHPVPPLDVPAGAAPSPAAVTAAPAGRLFVDRARAVVPQFALTEANAPAVAAICARLAGIPLALEIAAARVRLLPPAGLLARLDEAMAAAGARDLPQRQRTMRATLDWSYDLLDDSQRRLFRRLAVFSGGCCLEAVEAVGAAGVAEPVDVLADLEGLVERSLVIAGDGPDGRRRFRMLEPVAQYARARLGAGAEADAVGQAHTAFFLALAERARPEYEGAEQLRWLARVEADDDNLVAAVNRALAAGDAATAGRLGWALWLYWWLRGHLTLGRRLMEATLAHDLPAPVRSRALSVVGAMAFAQGDHDAAGRWWQEAYEVATAVGDVAARATALSGVGLVALATGDPCGAATLFGRSVSLAEAAGPDGKWVATLVQVWLGTAVMATEGPDAAEPHLARGLASARRRGDRLATYVALFNLAEARLARGVPEAARPLLEEGARLSEQTRDLANLAYFLDALAVVEDGAGRPTRVATLLGAAQALRETVGSNVYGYYRPDETLRERAAERARAALGTDPYDDALDAGRAFDLAAAVAYACAPNVGAPGVDAPNAVVEVPAS